MHYIVSVRYGTLKILSDFYTRIADLSSGEVVIRTNRGVELGEVVRKVEGTIDNFKEGGPDEVIRIANDDDKAKQLKIDKEISPGESAYCKKKIRELNVPMKLIGIEHLFGGKKIIIHYTAGKRIDFRELVKDLASEFQARIEMKQIGVRDEARMLADYQHCGRELCCRTFLKNLDPVAMKMAKRQKATMDPAKISGRCGKLMCCLRYEDEVYEEFKKNLPRKGMIVTTVKGEGEIVGHEILAQNVIIETSDRKHFTVALDEITECKGKKTPVKLLKSDKCNNNCKK